MVYDEVWTPAKGAWLAHAGDTGAQYNTHKASALAEGFHEHSHNTCNSGQTHTSIWRK